MVGRRQPISLLRIVGLLSLVTLLLAGCGGGAAVGSLTVGSLTTKASSIGHGPRGWASFRLREADGKTIVVPKPGVTTVLYFLSAGCGECVSGEQEIRSIVRWLPKDVELVSIDVAPAYDTSLDLEQFAKAVGATWPHAFASVALLRHYRVERLEQLAVVDREGRLVFDGLIPPAATLLGIVRRASDGGAS